VPARPGLVFERCPKRRRQLLGQGRGPDPQTRRAAATLIAFACDSEEIQKVLPQIFVVNEHILAQAEIADFATRCSSTVSVLRRKSSWVSTELMVDIVGKLAFSLQAVLTTHQVILHFDAYSAHLHVDVFKECARLGIFAHVVPASMTGWLQPLDVAVFSRYKGWVVREVERRRLSSTSGSLSRLGILDVYREGIAEVIQSQGWGRAFDLTGLRSQANLSKRLLSRLGLSSPPEISSSLPTYEDFQAIFPAGKSIPIEAAMEIVLARERRERTLRLPSCAKLPPAMCSQKYSPG
jgi:hypothetical protein